MPLDECTDSVSQMLDAVGMEPSRQRAQLAQHSAALARGWPQHLNFVHKAVARELIRASGSATGIDFERIESAVTADRIDYYHRRLSGPALDRNATFTCSVFAAIHEESPSAKDELSRLCEREMERTGRIDNLHCGIPPQSLAEALVEKGVVSQRDGRMAVAVPSMATWAVEQARRRTERTRDGA